MNLKEIQVKSSANLRQTYFDLGLAMPNTTKLSEQGFEACVGEFEHPICNFAAGLNLDPWSTKNLLTLAASKPSFNVYCLPGDEPEHVRELLYRSRFRVSYSLAQLVAEPVSQPAGDSPDMRMAVTSEYRYEICRFMTDQFFARQTEGFRRRVARATADAERLEIYEMVDSNQRIGAVMVCRSEDVVGIYNLCVASSKRGKGLGRHLTGWAVSLAKGNAKLVTLQCDARLKSWYESQGFCQTGAVEVYTLSKSATSDIMSST